MKERTRKEIIEVAAELFKKNGFHKTSMDEIARTAKKAKGSLYYHFASKEELFTVVVSLEFEALKSELLKVVEDKNLNPLEKAKAYLIRRNQMLSQAHNYHETLKTDFIERFDDIEALRQELFEWEKVHLGKILKEGMTEGYFVKIDNIDMVLDIFFMVLKGLEIPLFLQKRHTDFGPYIGDMINILLRALTIQSHKTH
jgi:AcrR family transcriptional regulator